MFLIHEDTPRRDFRGLPPVDVGCVEFSILFRCCRARSYLDEMHGQERRLLTDGIGNWLWGLFVREMPFVEVPPARSAQQDPIHVFSARM